MDKPKIRYHYQRGVSLIEVLVAMFLLGIAVIGFVALQVKSVTSTSESLYRTQAVSIAQDMSERIRANYAQIAAYRQADWTVMPTQDCYANTCTAAEMVNFDVRLAKEVAGSSLPNGTISASTCKGSNNLCIYVAWGDTTTASTGTNPCVTSAGAYSGTPECVMMEVYNES